MAALQKQQASEAIKIIENVGVLPRALVAEIANLKKVQADFAAELQRMKGQQNGLRNQR